LLSATRHGGWHEDCRIDPADIDAWRVLVRGEEKMKKANDWVADTLFGDEELELNPNWTGIPLAVRVYQGWTHRPNRDTDGYPCNTPSRPPLLRWNPYTARYGHQP
jgi:hypothetical protein